MYVLQSPILDTAPMPWKATNNAVQVVAVIAKVVPIEHIISETFAQHRNTFEQDLNKKLWKMVIDHWTNRNP